MLVVSRFAVPDGQAADFRARALAAVEVLAARPGFVRARLGRAVDDPDRWVLVSEWDGIGSWRRSLSAYDVRVHVAPLLGLALDEPGGYETVLSVDGADGVVGAASARAADAGSVGVGDASGPAVPTA